VSPHIAFVAALFIVWGSLTMVVGASTLALGIGAASLVGAPGRETASQLAAGLTAATFTALAVVALLWGAAHVAVGVPLRRHRAWSRHGALVLGTLDLVLLPFGTLVGGYALWALLREDTRKLFQN
jgi:hypothetical protein